MEPTIQLTTTVTIRDKTGFHTRTAAVFAKVAGGFTSNIRVRHQNIKEANAKSMLGLMSLGVKTGAEITIMAEGRDAEIALATLRDLVEHDFSVML